jgi:hypothetical protein
MPRADSIGSHPFSFRALKVVRPRHSPNFGQLARDLDAEAQHLETVGQMTVPSTRAKSATKRATSNNASVIWLSCWERLAS